jgi:hypothetical protein
LLQFSRAIRFDAVEIRVLDLATLIEVKRRAGRPKDLAVLPVLEATLEERNRGSASSREGYQPRTRLAIWSSVRARMQAMVVRTLKLDSSMWRSARGSPEARPSRRDCSGPLVVN